MGSPVIPAALFAMTFLQAPAFDACKVFVKTDIVGVLGADASDGQVLVPGTCSWNGKGANLTVSRNALGPDEAGLLLEARRASAGQGDVVKDEAGIGQRAISNLASNKRTLTLIAAAGTDLWTFTLSKGDQPVDADTILPRLRDLAKRAVAAK
jgi:hypothetical protein